MRRDGDFDCADYSALIGLIYDAAQSPELWPELLESIEDYFSEIANQSDINTVAQKKRGLGLEPHFMRAIKINQHISMLETRNHTSNQILNRLPIGVIITNEQAEITASNARADTVLKAHQCLHQSQGMIQTNSRKQTVKLHQLIREHAAGSNAQKGSSMLLQTEYGQPNTSIWVTTSDIPSHEEDSASRLVTLYIASPLIKPNYDITAIQENFALTRAEAKLIKALANGCHNMNDVATSLGVSIHTVRTQVKVIFEKTGTNSQIELVKKVLTSPAVLFGESQHVQTARKASKTQPSSGIHLHDGRQLGFVEYGNPEGKPIIYCHSLIHADKQLFHLPEMQQQIPYRIISPKRPGFLDSTAPTTSYSLQDHANDIIQLSKHLGLERFTVLAQSNGAPYAATLAQQFPQHVEKLILVSPFVPPHMDKLNALNTLDKFMYRFCKHMPRKAIERMTHIVLKNISENPNDFIDKNLPHMSESERQFAQCDDLRNYLKSWANAAFPSRIHAVSNDLLVRIRDWQFEPESIQVPVELWHAEDDSTVPIACSQQFAAAIPSCNSHWLKHGGHYIFFTQFEDIMQQSLS